MPNPYAVGEKLLASDLNKFFIKDTVIDLPELVINSANNVAIGGNSGTTDPNPFFMVVMLPSSNGTIYKFVKDETGQFIYTGVSATFTPNNPGYNNTNIVGITADGTYVYVCFQTDVSGTSGVTEVKRFAYDLTGATTITGFPSLTGTFPRCSNFYWDSTTSKFWVMTDSTTVKGFSISGTALTLTDTISLSVAVTAINVCLYKKANGSFVVLDGATTSHVQTVRIYGSTGTQTSALTRTIAGKYGSQNGIIAAGIINFYGTICLSLIRFIEVSSVLRQEIYFKPFNY